MEVQSRSFFSTCRLRSSPLVRLLVRREGVPIPHWTVQTTGLWGLAWLSHISGLPREIWYQLSLLHKFADKQTRSTQHQAWFQFERLLITKAANFCQCGRLEPKQDADLRVLRPLSVSLHVSLLSETLRVCPVLLVCLSPELSESLCFDGRDGNEEVEWQSQMAIRKASRLSNER